MVISEDEFRAVLGMCTAARRACVKPESIETRMKLRYSRLLIDAMPEQPQELARLTMAFLEANGTPILRTDRLILEKALQP